MYEGKFINGERHGFGKEYYPYGILEFEGEYFNGKKWNGKGYDPFNNLIYELKDGNGYIKNIIILTIWNLKVNI